MQLVQSGIFSLLQVGGLVEFFLSESGLHILKSSELGLTGVEIVRDGTVDAT